MKLYLSSYKFGDNPESLKPLARPGTVFAYIANAVDVFPDGERKDKTFNEVKEVLSGLGFGLEKLNLLDYFNKSAELNEKMKSYGGAWVVGGNTFVLRRAMKYSGFDNWLNSKKGDDFVYGGWSAGICVLAKSLRGLENMDEPNIVPGGYKSDVIWEGIGLLNYLIIPHYKSPGHPETEAAGRTAEYMEKNHLPYKTISDGQVLIQSSGKGIVNPVVEKSDIAR